VQKNGGKLIDTHSKSNGRRARSRIGRRGGRGGRRRSRT